MVMPDGALSIGTEEQPVQAGVTLRWFSLMVRKQMVCTSRQARLLTLALIQVSTETDCSSLVKYRSMASRCPKLC